MVLDLLDFFCIPSNVLSDHRITLLQGHMRAGSMSDGQVQRLWGVVVQSREQGGMEGCYVLKTLSSTAADCRRVKVTRHNMLLATEGGVCSSSTQTESVRLSCSNMLAFRTTLPSISTSG